MTTFRTVLGGSICVASFFGLFYCALLHGEVCSSLPTFNLASQHVVAYPCKGLTAFITPRQEALLHQLPLLLVVTMLLGGYIGRWRSVA